MLWLLGGCIVLAVIGSAIQMRMTWSQEHMQSVAREAEGAAAVARDGAERAKPDSNPFAPLIEVFNEMNAASSAQ